MENNSDPFASIASLCHISSSQEEQLNRCHFALESSQEDEEEDSGPAGFPVASTGIVMLSAPETPEETQHGNDNENYTSQENPSNDNNQDDVFHTPPEEPSFQPLSVDDFREEDHMDRETDRDFSVGEGLGERIGGGNCGDGGVHDKEVIHCEWASAGDGECEYAVKKLKVSGDNLGFLTPNQCSRGERVEILGRLVRSEEKLKSPLRRKCKDLKLRATGGGQDNNRATFEKAMEILKSPLRKLETFYENLVTGSSKDNLGAGLDGGGGGLVEPAGKPSYGGSSSRSRGIETVQNGLSVETGIGMDSGHGEFSEEIPEKGELKFSTEVLEPDFGQIEGGDGAVNNEIEGSEANGLCSAREDTDKHGYVGSKRGTPEKCDVVKRALPASFELKENVEPREVDPDNVLPRRNVVTDDVGHEETEHPDITLLDVLRRLAKDYTYDASLDSLSIMEVAKRRGITFP